VLSIVVGVLADGMIAGSREILANDLATANASTNPFSAMITTTKKNQLITFLNSL